MAIIRYITRFNTVNCATANRVISSANGIKANGDEVEIINIGSASIGDESLDVLHVPIVTLSNINNKYLQVIIALLKSIKYVLDRQIVIIYLQQPFFLFWFSFFASKQTFLALEVTEYPDVKGKGYWYDYFSKKFNVIITISHALKEHFLSLGYTSNRIYVFPMIVDPERFINVNKQISNYQYIAYCGEMSGNKDGLHDLIKAFSAFSLKHPEIILLLIGDSKNIKEYLDLQRMTVNLGISTKVIFTGRISRNEMPLILKNASVLVLARPDNHQAKGGFPTKVGEYLATGNPIVLTRTGELDYYLKDNIDCFFVEPNNPDAFSERLSYVFDNYEIARKVGKEGQKKVFSEFNYKVQTKYLLDFFKCVQQQER